MRTMQALILYEQHAGEAIIPNHRSGGTSM